MTLNTISGSPPGVEITGSSHVLDRAVCIIPSSVRPGRWPGHCVEDDDVRRQAHTGAVDRGASTSVHALRGAGASQIGRQGRGRLGRGGENDAEKDHVAALVMHGQDRDDPAVVLSGIGHLYSGFTNGGGECV